MEDMFGLNASADTIGENGSREPTLSHVVDLLALRADQVAAINEQQRLEQSKGRLFSLVQQVCGGLAELGCYAPGLFEKDERLKRVMTLYISEFVAKNLPPPEHDPVKFKLQCLNSHHLAIARLFADRFKRSFIVNADDARATFSGWGYSVALPAVVETRGVIDVDGPVFGVILDHLESTGVADVDLNPDLYQVNGTHIYPPPEDLEPLPAEMPRNWNFFYDRRGNVSLEIGKSTDS